MTEALALAIPGLGLIGWVGVAWHRGYVNFSKRLDTNYAIWREYQPAAFWLSVCGLLSVGCGLLFLAVR